jgi:hypothetical protein
MHYGLRPAGLVATTAVAALFMLMSLSASGLSGAGLDNAQAYSSGTIHCPPSGLIYPGSRCMDGRRVQHRTVEFQPFQVWGTTGTYCAGAKTQPDGSGGNSMPFACAGVNTQFARSGPYAQGQTSLGYGALLNNTNDIIVLGNAPITWYP